MIPVPTRHASGSTHALTLRVSNEDSVSHWPVSTTLSYHESLYGSRSFDILSIMARGPAFGPSHTNLSSNRRGCGLQGLSPEEHIHD